MFFHLPASLSCSAIKPVQMTASCLLDLAQRANQLFKERDDGLRQKLLEYVLSNIELKDKMS